jgi:hypothetical protein
MFKLAVISCATGFLSIPFSPAAAFIAAVVAAAALVAHERRTQRSF